MSCIRKDKSANWLSARTSRPISLLGGAAAPKSISGTGPKCPSSPASLSCPNSAAMAASKSSVKLSGDGFSSGVSGGEVAAKSGVAPSAAPSAMSAGAAASSRAACVPCTPCAGVSPTGSASKMALMASAISAMRRISLSSSAINSSPSTLKATTMAWGQNAFALYRISISLYNNCRK